MLSRAWRWLNRNVIPGPIVAIGMGLLVFTSAVVEAIFAIRGQLSFLDGVATIACGLLGVSFIFSSYSRLRAQQRSRLIDARLSARQCVRCGYNLTGATSRQCPECGRHHGLVERQLTRR